jgi:hypothetical protein
MSKITKTRGRGHTVEHTERERERARERLTNVDSFQCTDILVFEANAFRNMLLMCMKGRGLGIWLTDGLKVDCYRTFGFDSPFKLTVHFGACVFSVFFVCV